MAFGGSLPQINLGVQGVTPNYTRALGDRPRNLEQWSSDEDDTCAAIPPLLSTTSAGGRLSSRQIQTHDIPATSLLP
ncbi:hypothetical protein TNCV_2780821 [Trichonephila clavipes]|nr:hypothetical protein TNCV_2780821 [Trichonephila clavipes]